MSWGTPKYGNTSFNTWGLKEGHNIYRILPPVHSLAAAMKWSIYVGLHFGYSGVDQKDSAKTRQRPFKCIQQRNRNGMVEQDCPACDAIERQEASYKKLEAKLISEGVAEDVMETQLAPLAGWLKTYSVDRKHYLNVMNQNNEFGWLKINHKFNKKALDAKIDEIRAKKIEPLALDQGVWFDFIRTGTKLNVHDTLEILKENRVIEGQSYESIKLAPLSEELADKALAEVRDLATVGTELSYDQIRMLVECSGEPEEIDKIFAMSQKTSAAAPARAPAATKPVGGPPAPVTPPAGVKVPDPNDPAVQARLAKIKAKQQAEKDAKAAADLAAKAATDAAAAAAALDADEPETTPEVEMDDESFMAFFKTKAS